MAKARLINRFKSCEKGNVLVEFGLVATLMMSTVLGAVEYASVMDQTSKMSNAARSAVEKAMEDPADITAITEVAKKSGDLDGSVLSVSVNTFCECPGGIPITCTDTCAGGVTNSSYVSVSLSQPVQSIVQGSSLLDGYTLSRSATMRLR